MKPLYLALAKLIGLVVLAAPLSLAAAPQHGLDETTVLNGLLSSIARHDYVGFAEMGTPEFATITEQQFQAVANQLATRLESGYRTDYLGSIRRQGLDFSVWKVEFTDGGDDVLATLNMVDDRVGGFFLQ